LYTGTHDNDTSNGWYASTSPEIQNNFRSYLNISGQEASWEMLRFSYRTVSPLVIIPVQDFLGLGSEARFNQPGISLGNWKWRLSKEQLEHLHLNCSAYLYEQAKVSGRLTKNSLKDLT
jgi:4-alpha-glucanotransferase